jgi:geranylgeranyl pyrophosphate synthase
MKVKEQFQSLPSSGIILRQEGAMLRIFFDIAEVVEEPITDGKDATEDSAEGKPVIYEAYNVNVQAPFNYGNIISAMVNDRYTADDVQALQANYIEAKDAESSIADDKREEYLSEWSEFQSWRSRAKELASEIVERLNA